ncbi:MAG: aminoglycoside phosphotransferase family protein [Desulfobacteraceae bacterium]|jgi:aminoglycoside phosphotransferase (APT) family kinase protein
MAHEGMAEKITRFLKARNWVDDVEAVSFLAAGEYNENYLVTSGKSRFVLRINHGSQLGLGEQQIAYEYRVLQALEESGVTPRPFACDPESASLGGGVLLMEYLPGRALRYDRDLDRAASIFARVHTTPVPEGLVVQPDPVMDIARECRGLIERYPNHPLRRERDQIRSYFESVQQLAKETWTLFEEETLCLVNTEVNSGNFLISDEGAFLVDWEKAVVSCRYQDLGHFLVPTTTLWKSETVLSPENKTRFLDLYRQEACLDLDMDELTEKARVLEKTILLRALSWCFMAYYEYTQTDRPIRNPDTFAKITQYMADIPWILGSVT